MNPRAQHELFEDNMAEADAMARQADELKALTEQEQQRRIDEALAWSAYERDELMQQIETDHADHNTETGEAA